METDTDLCGWREEGLGRNGRHGGALLDERNRQREEASFHNMCRLLSLLFQAMAISLLLLLSLSFWFSGDSSGTTAAKTFVQMASFVVVPFLVASMFFQCSPWWGTQNST